MWDVWFLGQIVYTSIEHPSIINKKISLVTASCTTVTCAFTIDGVVDSAEYNGNALTITSADLSDWTQVKSVTFDSCYDSSPGTLSVKGSGSSAQGNLSKDIVTEGIKPIKRVFIYVLFSVTHIL